MKLNPIVRNICRHSLDKPEGVVRFYNIEGVDCMTAKRYTFKTTVFFGFKYSSQKKLISVVYTIKKNEISATLQIRSHSKITQYEITHEEYDLLEMIFKQKSLHTSQIFACCSYKKVSDDVEYRIIVTKTKDFVLQTRVKDEFYTEDGWRNLKSATSVDEIASWKVYFK